MVFGPTPMRRLSLAVPIAYEDKVIDKIGELGTVHLIKEFQMKRMGKSETLEISTRFQRLNDKFSATLEKEKGKEYARPETEPSEVKDIGQIESFLTKAETEMYDLVSSLEGLDKEVKDLTATKEKLSFLVENGLRTDEIGNFRHLFVKAGFLKSSLTGRLATYLGGTSIVSVAHPGRARESFIVIAGLNEDQVLAEQALKLLNFEEVTLPPGLNGDSKLALNKTEEEMQVKKREIEEIKAKMLELKAQSDLFAPYAMEATKYEEAKDRVIRTKTKSLIHGWIPCDQIESFKTQLEQVVPKDDIYLKLEEPKVEDSVPVEFKNKGVLKAFELFTSLQGIPSYFEVNPTPIYALLYVVMFGMMFGDIGAGIVLVILGTVVTRFRGGFFAFSSKSTKQIAHIMISCGVLTIVFGFLYGVFFLMRTPLPYLLHPLDDAEKIMVVALVFGVVQITLSLVLNISNMLRRKEPMKAILGERGVTGLVFYASGIVLGYAFITQKNLGVFVQGNTAIFTVIALVALALIFLSPLVESILQHENISASKKLLEGFGKGLESFIAFIANSVSYIRLAAFAIAHEAIGIAAIVLGTVFGNVLSLVLLNTLDFVVEGFASFIQSLRLMYYEFSTRFFLKEGVAYTPFKLGHVRIKI